MAVPSSDVVAEVTLTPEAGYAFRASVPTKHYPPWLLDVSPPTGGGRGPNPEETLGSAIAHCLSATLINTMARSRVPISAVTTHARVSVGRNARGRSRVQKLEVEMEVVPTNEEDRERFDRGVGIFEDYCTVSGAVREGIPITVQVRSARDPTAVPTKA